MCQKFSQTLRSMLRPKVFAESGCQNLSRNACAPCVKNVGEQLLHVCQKFSQIPGVKSFRRDARLRASSGISAWFGSTAFAEMRGFGRASSRVTIGVQAVSKRLYIYIYVYIDYMCQSLSQTSVLTSFSSPAGAPPPFAHLLNSSSFVVLSYPPPPFVSFPSSSSPHSLPLLHLLLQIVPLRPVHSLLAASSTFLSPTPSLPP